MDYKKRFLLLLILLYVQEDFLGPGRSNSIERPLRRTLVLKVMLLSEMRAVIGLHEAIPSFACMPFKLHDGLY